MPKSRAKPRRMRTLLGSPPAPFDAWPPGDGEADKWTRVIPAGHPYSPDQLNKIARALGQTADVRHVGEVAQVAWRYAAHLERGIDIPPRDPHKLAAEELDKMAEYADKLADVREHCGVYIRRALERAGLERALGPLGIRETVSRIDVLFTATRDLAVHARVASREERSKSRPDRGGRTPMTARARFLRHVAEIFEDATKTRATIRANTRQDGIPHGPFFDFLKASCSGLSRLGDLNDDALAAAARRARAKGHNPSD